MISLNLNAIQEWERVRRDTEPHTPDVDRNPGAEQPDPADIDDGSHGNRVHPVVRRRGQDQEPEETEHETDEAYEVDIGAGDDGFGPPPDGPRAPTEPYQARHVDEEA